MARRLRRLAFAGAALALLLTAVAVFAPFGGDGVMAAVVIRAEGLPHGWAALIAGILAVLVAAALLALARMLACVERGEIFAPAATRRFRRFALLMMLAAAAALVLPALARVGLALTEGRDTISLMIDGDQVLWLFLTIVLFFLARLFDEAARYEQDSRSIV